MGGPDLAMSRSEVSECLAPGARCRWGGEALLPSAGRGERHVSTYRHYIYTKEPKLVSVSSGSLAHELDDIQEVRTLGTRDPDHRQLGLALHGSSIAGEALHVYIYKEHSNRHNTTCSIQRYT